MRISIEQVDSDEAKREKKRKEERETQRERKSPQYKTNADLVLF